MKVSSRLGLLGTSLGLLLACSAADVRPTLLITAPRFAREAAPEAASAILTTNEIARSGATDAADLLARALNLQLRTLNANPRQAQVALRGFGENGFGRVKILLDGVELNAVDMSAPDLAQIPVSALQRVEFVPGPSPVLEGDNALAGVIRLQTDAGAMTSPTNATALEAHVGSYGRAGATFQSAGRLSDAPVGYSVVAAYDRADGWRDRTAYDQYTARAAIRQDWTGGSSLTFRANYGYLDYEMAGALPWAMRRSRDAARLDDDCREKSSGLVLENVLALDDDRRLVLESSLDARERRAHWGASSYSPAYDNDYRLLAARFAARYVDETAWGDFDKTFSAGLDARYDRDVVKDRSGWNAPRTAFNRLRSAAFLHNELFLSENWSVITGTRLELIHNRWDGTTGLTEDFSRDIQGDGEIGLVYRPFDALRTFLKATRFHRSAFCDELNYTQDGRFLKPETGYSLDLGFSAKPTREATIEGSLFAQRMEDEIFFNPYAVQSGGYWGGYNCNSPARTERLGTDLSLAWRRQGVAEAAVRESWVFARFGAGQYEDARIPLVPENRVRVEAGVWLLPSLEIKAGCRHQSGQFMAQDFENVHSRLSGVVLFDCSLIYEPESWAPGWRAILGLDNLLNRRFCDFACWSDYTGASCYPAAGRSLFASLRYSF